MKRSCCWLPQPMSLSQPAEERRFAQASRGGARGPAPGSRGSLATLPMAKWIDGGSIATKAGTCLENNDGNPGSAVSIVPPESIVSVRVSTAASFAFSSASLRASATWVVAGLNAEPTVWDDGMLPGNSALASATNSATKAANTSLCSCTGYAISSVGSTRRLNGPIFCRLSERMAE